MKVGQEIPLFCGLTVVIDTAREIEKGVFACVAHFLYADTCFFAIFGENSEII